MNNEQYITINDASSFYEAYSLAKAERTARYGIIFGDDFSSHHVVDFENDVEVLNCPHYISQSRIKLNQRVFTQKVWFCINKNTQECDKFYFFDDIQQKRSISQGEKTSNGRLMTLNNIASFCLDKTLVDACDTLIKLATYNNRFNLDKWQACNRENEEKAKAIALLEKLGAEVPTQLTQKAAINTDFLNESELQQLAKITAKMQEKLTQLMLQDYSQE